MCFDQNVFPESFTIFCSDRVSSTKSKGGGFLIAVSSRACTFKCRYDLQFYHECTWVKISTQSSPSLLIGNDYPPDTKQDVISKYFCSLEKNLDTTNKCSFD
jgi:hypothetical protein